MARLLPWTVAEDLMERMEDLGEIIADTYFFDFREQYYDPWERSNRARARAKYTARYEDHKRILNRHFPQHGPPAPPPPPVPADNAPF